MKAILFTLFCFIGMNAQSIKADGTHFIDGITDKNWSNSNGKDYTKASFKDYTGSCCVWLEADENVLVSFEATSIIKKGKLEFKLIDESENEYFYCSTSEACNLKKEITLEKGKKYRLFFTGENANGKYNINWKIKSKIKQL